MPNDGNFSRKSSIVSRSGGKDNNRKLTGLDIKPAVNRAKDALLKRYHRYFWDGVEGVIEIRNNEEKKRMNKNYSSNSCNLNDRIIKNDKEVS